MLQKKNWKSWENWKQKREQLRKNEFWAKNGERCVRAFFSLEREQRGEQSLCFVGKKQWKNQKQKC